MAATPEEKAIRLLRKHWDVALVMVAAHACLALLALDRPWREIGAAFLASLFWFIVATLRRDL